MPLLLALPFVLLAFAEIAVFIAVGDAIGIGAVLLLVIASAIVGGWLVKRQGLGVLARMRAAIDRGEPPVREVFDGACILIGGFLMIVPGFVSDVLGILLLLPPFRSALRGFLGKRFAVITRMQHVRRGPGGRPRVIEADYVEIEPERPALKPDDHPWRPPPRENGA